MQFFWTIVALVVLLGLAWRFLGSGVPLTCTEERLVPTSVLKVWVVPATSPGCKSA